MPGLLPAVMVLHFLTFVLEESLGVVMKGGPLARASLDALFSLAPLCECQFCSAWWLICGNPDSSEQLDLR